MTAPGHSIGAHQNGGIIATCTPGGKLRFQVNDDVWALTVKSKETLLDRSQIGLAL